MKLKDEILKLNAITEELLGIENLNQKKKTSELVLGRMVVCNILMDNKIKPAVLAKHYDKDRTNFYHYRKRHCNYLENPRIHPEYIKMYIEVHEEYIKRAKDARTLNNLERLDVLDQINTNIDELLLRKTEVLLALKTNN
tara:strand:+ start:1141 stop:1560 length:420 start_codon:yes stop_codon:yes gene_type:complete